MMNLSQWQDQAQSFSFSGHSIAYWQAGDWGNAQRDVLLLIHGFPTASWDWHHQWQDLAKHFRVLAVDMLGFGFSDKPRSHSYSIFEQADLLQTLLKHLDVTQAHLFAHDYGDTVAQEMLARDLEAGAGAVSLQSVCLLNGGLFPETHRATVLQKLLHSPLGAVVAKLTNERRFRRGFSAVFGAKTKPSEAELTEYWALLNAGAGTGPISHKLIRYISERRQNRQRWVRALQEFPKPLRLICGESDPVSGGHMAARYRELIAKPDVVLLPGIGHYPQCEAPTAVLQAFLQFHHLPVD